MASLIGAFQRNWQIFSPPQATKADGALKFGILGAATIAPLALINPARSHPDVIIHAVAARDERRAAAFAKKHGIPEVKASYQALLDDPAIDAVYVPLPNGLHFEWALRALRAGKHVLLEKPSVANATDAGRLFRAPELSSSSPSGPPVLLEAFHYRFQPAWHYFLTLVDRPHLASLSVAMSAPALAMPPGDIRFDFSLAGGAMMDLGTYAVSVVRQVFGAEPEKCLSANLKMMPPPQQDAEYAFAVSWRMSGGAVADVKGNLRAGLAELALPRIVVTHKPVQVNDDGGGGGYHLPVGQEKVRTRTLTFVNWMVSAFWHRIDIEDRFVIRDSTSGAVVKKWKVKESKKAYTFAEAGLEGPGEPSWTTYRHQLEQFVNRVRGRETTSWVDLEDSLAQMKVIDDVYVTAGLPIRSSSSFK